jgi:hypothetical protein
MEANRGLEKKAFPMMPRDRWARTPQGIAAAVFALAFAVRLVWVLGVQSPFNAVFTDMAGYVERAQWLIDHTTPADPRALDFYPYGTHYLLALEFLVFGRDAQVAIAIVHALVGAVPAACMVPLTLRLVPSRAAAAIAGVLVALWQPQVVYTGFFMSEIWFSALVALHAWLSVRHGTRPWRLLPVGLLSAVAFVVRPQFLLTWVLDTFRHALVRGRRRGLRAAGGVLVWLAAPMLVAITVSSVRLHRLSGHWGLISENANLNRVFADTEVCRVESSWTTPTGERWSWHFSPPAKPPCEEKNVARFEGFIGDAQLLEPIRRARLQGVSWASRLLRMVDNVELLVVRNLLFPEDAYAAIPWRLALQQGFAVGVLYAVLPLCAVGLLLGRGDRTKFVILANFAAVVVASARYYGEARYRTPYDPFAILLAVVGVHQLGGRLVGLGRRLRCALTKARRARALTGATSGAWFRLSRSAERGRLRET